VTVTARLVVLFVLLVGGRAVAGSEPPAARLVVDFVSGGAGGEWFASALEQTVAHELSRFRTIEVVQKLDAGRCATRETRCLVELYREAGVQLVVLGRLRRELLEYEVYATWARGRAFDGSLAVVGVDAATLRRHIGEIARPIVQRGGLADQRPLPSLAPAATVAAVPVRAGPPKPAPATTAPATTAPATTAPATTAPATTAPAAPAPHPFLPGAILLGLIAFIALPCLLLRLLLGASELRKRGRPASWKWSGALIAALALALVGTAVLDVPALLATWTPRSDGTADLVLAIAAGILWGAFVLVNAGWVFSPLHGLGQARHDAIWPLLQSWLALAFLRALLLLLYVPVLLFALLACEALDLPARASVGLALPAAGLLVYVWLLTLVDNLALFLDAQLVAGTAGARNPWHATIKRYFRGYVRRNGVDVDAALFERTLFLPSLVPTVVSYGGGFARPRILVGEQAREAALGQLPDEDELPERTVNPEELPFGFILPSATPSPAGREASLFTKSAEQRRHELTQAPSRPRAAAPRVLGENATLLGWVMPQASGDGVPLISNDSDDFDVVRGLLTEHYAKFERNADDDEIDDTDPTQKDFLFGALLREMAMLASRDTYLSTIRLSLSLAEPKASRLSRAVIRGTIGFYDRFLAGPAARVADAHAALNQALHHLIQYLFFLRGEPASLLTVRANAPRLIQTSKDMLERMDRAAIPAVERQLLRATPRNRLLWMSQFFHARLGRRRDRTFGLVAALAFALLAGAGILFAVREAIDYHPIYVERMKSQASRSIEGASSHERPAKQ
jgi:hypothetical protein